MTKFQIKNIVVASYLLTGMFTAGLSFFNSPSDNQLNQVIVAQLDKINLPSQAIEPLKKVLKQHCSIEQ
jgi:hypothetical protein